MPASPDQFIAENVNPARGGYRPDEVAALIRQAFQAAREGYTSNELVVEKLRK